MPTGLFEPFRLGDLTLPNRMVMAPMTRNRAAESGDATPMMATYYAQRASAGLIIAESTPVSPDGVGYPFTPGIYTDAHVASWLRVTNAVHSAGGRIFVQLLHCGRISHPSLQPGNATPVAPSALRPIGQAVTYTGPRDFVTPRALGTDEIPDVIEQYRVAAVRALRAGFDGIEVHAGNGYLVDQFLRDGSNQRTDGYGGSVENRLRLLAEILDAVGEVWPAHRVGVRLTPENSFNTMSDSDPQGHFEHVFARLSMRGLAYVHVLEGDMMKTPDIEAGFTHVGATGPGAGNRRTPDELDYRALHRLFAGTYIANNAYDLERAQATLRADAAELVAFGRPFLANPDLVRRYRHQLPLNTADPSTFYVGGENGYIDYPSYLPAESHAIIERAIA